MDSHGRTPLATLQARVLACRRCPRLVAHREEVACHPPRRFLGERYWARPLPGFGDARARLLVVGLAPAAHGGNRTGRMFTGDQSGLWLFRALFEAGFASQAESVRRGDGLVLTGAYVSAAARCAPPLNKLTPEEKERCRPYLVEEMRILAPRVLVALGAIAWDACLRARAGAGLATGTPKPRFGHLAEARFADGAVLLGSYHPSQQNTFTGKLTRGMLAAVFARARRLL